MMTSGYAKKNLDEQERIIADWMAQHNLTSADVTAPNSQIKPKPWRCFSISANPVSAPKAGVTVTELPKPVTAVKNQPLRAKKHRQTSRILIVLVNTNLIVATMAHSKAPTCAKKLLRY